MNQCLWHHDLAEVWRFHKMVDFWTVRYVHALHAAAVRGPSIKALCGIV